METRTPAPQLPKVALLGRPNVGKSTLFNMLVRGRGALKAVTHATAGTTRDVRQTPGRLGNLGFLLLDTAGVEEGKVAHTSHKGHRTGGRDNDSFPLQRKLNELSLEAASTADVLVLLLDGGAGVLPADRALAQKLRKMGKPVLLVVNKVDLKIAQTTLEEAETLGLGTPIGFSAAHGQGVDDLYEALSPYVPALPDEPEEDEEAEADTTAAPAAKMSDVQPSGPQKGGKGHPQAAELQNGTDEGPIGAENALFSASAPEEPDFSTDAAEDIEEEDESSAAPEPAPLKAPKIAILGRPNVGKSTLVNALLGQERMLTGPVAGLTREAIENTFSYNNQEFTLVDTPGLRRKGKVDKEGLEFLSVGQSIQAVENADIIVLVVDAGTHNVDTGQWRIFEQQDAQIASMILNQYKPLIIALNKWDAVKDKAACLDDVRIQLHHRLHGIHQPLALPISAQRSKGLDVLLQAVTDVWQSSHRTFSTGKLNNLLNKTLAKRSPPLASGKVVSLKFIRQTGVNPPSFTFWGNRIDQVSDTYKQFLRNQLAATLGLQNLPVRIYFRANANPFSARKPSKKQ